MPSSPGSDRERQPQQQPQEVADTSPESTDANGNGDGRVVAELEERNAQLEDRWKRALADLDNYRKRATRDADRRVADSREAVLRDWLEVVDAVDRALRLAADDPAATRGLRAVLEQMEAMLARYGVTRVGEPGEPFDPERHEAVGVVASSDAPDRTVLDVQRSGYATRDRLLRPAQVIVSRREG